MTVDPQDLAEFLRSAENQNEIDIDIKERDDLSAVCKEKIEPVAPPQSLRP